jgi:hypothetical protein
LAKLAELGINIGKFQVSSAIRVVFDEQKAEKLAALAQYNEPTYLHQVVALKEDGSFEKFTDLGDALIAAQTVSYQEWRVHFTYLCLSNIMDFCHQPETILLKHWLCINKSLPPIISKSKHTHGECCPQRCKRL